MNPPKYGDVISIMDKGNRIDCVVTHERRIMRGRNTGQIEYTLAPLVRPPGKTYAYRYRGADRFGKPSKGWTKKQIETAMGKERETRDSIQSTKYKRAERGREAIGDLDRKRPWHEGPSGTKIGLGDEVLVRYRNISPRWETVVKVNFKTGKVAIARHLSQWEHERHDFATLLRTIGAHAGRGRKPYRWVHPDSIKNIRSPRKPLPFGFTKATSQKLEATGWTQVELRGEFILTSYVVAKSKDLARKGTTYESNDHVIYFDEDLNVFWRDTGCFD